MPRALQSLLAAAVVAATPAVASAQSAVTARSADLGVDMGGLFFLGGAEGLSDTFAYRIAGAYNFTRHIAAHLGVDFSPREVNQVSVTHVHLAALYRPLSHAWFVPFVGAGPSLAVTTPKDGDADVDPAVSAMAGVDLYPWERVGFRASTRYMARFGTDDDETTSHDLIASLGMFVTFGDQAPTGPILLDTDGDGFLDPDDLCVNVPGHASAQGCPDIDGDTIVDADDRCPNDPGTKALAGCPDKDGDDIADLDDRCPDVPGTPAHKGCPDLDGDDIADLDDRCPKIPGDKRFGGCPPPPPEEVVKKYSGAIAGITFKYDSAEIEPSSFPVLDEAAAVLAEYAHLVVLIEGHTSAEGSAQYNQELSQRRAESVRQYLVDKGIAAERLQAKGFGKDNPVATNDTEEGRAQNRRIEFKILVQ